MTFSPQAAVARFYLVRHGESTWNAAGRIQGKQDPALSERGQEQVAALANWFRYVPLNAVYSSPQQRAYLTARSIAQCLELPIRVDPDLAEINHGGWEGLTEEEVARDFATSYDIWRNRPTATQMPGGEHFVALRTRVRRAWQRIVEDDAGRHVVVVSHDVPLKVIIADTLGLSLDHVGRFLLANAGVSVIERYTDRTYLLQLNASCHLRTIGRGS
jgi:broad specificity phosphatase PhoE